MKLNFFNLRTLLFVFVVLLTQLAHAQSKKITGMVSDQLSGEPLPGVTIVVDGTTIGTTTDFDGKYSISAESGSNLVFSYIGYIKQTIGIKDQSEINVSLLTDTEDLGEVVIIGYGTVKKDDATGSITTVSSDDFNKGAITSPQELIIGKSAGVVVTTQGGQAGAGATIRIRGGSSISANNDPLIVIDGFPVDNTGISGLSNPLSTVNPNDIESMTVLKDASATAIYGSRASNGVIIITTKKGKAGAAMKISYNGYASLSQQTKFEEVLTGDQFREIMQQRVTDGLITDAALTRIGTENTDWQSEVFRNAISMDHNISINGSHKNMPYRASLGYTDQNGTLEKNNFGRTSIDLSATPSFFENHLKVNLNLKGIDIVQDFSNQGAIGAAVVFDPTQPVMNGNTRFGGYTAWTELNSGDPLNGMPNNIATHNPVALINLNDNSSHVNRVIANAQLNYQFQAIPELRANLNMGYDLSSSKGHNNNDPLAAFSYSDPNNNMKDYEQQIKNQLLDFYLNYNKELPGISSKIDATAGYSWQHFYHENTNSNRPFEMTDGVYVGADTIINRDENYLVSFFGRVNYTLMDKYLVTLTLRDDGSSRFSKQNRWGLFPSAAFAWKINEESFLRNVREVSELKLRLGWGVTGQQDIGNAYPYIPIYKTSTQGAYYQFGDQFYPTLRPNPYDALIKWEETATLNAGLDFGFFDDKFVGSVDVYKRTTSDLINTIPISVGSNFSNFLTTNVGSLENKGFEAALTYRPIVTKDFTLEFGGTFSYNQNTITKVNKVDDPANAGYFTGGISGGVGNTVQINSVGHPVNSFFLYQQVYDQSWNPIEGLYVDRSSDEESVSSGDNARKYFAGKPAPDYIIGFNIRADYKNFDFALNGRVSIGNYVYNNNASSRALYDNLYNQSGFASNLPASIYNSNFKTAQYWSDFYLEDGSFLKLDNISLGYSFSKLFSTKVSGRVGLTVQNAFVYTKYSGLDPEVDGGIDNSIYPRPRTVMLGLNLNF
ncbi:MAG: SusC/RagA family TonB-linked outer membrane protein [Prolixibacteraceae bacterium]